MTTLMVIAHAPLASALRSCAAHVFPDEGESILVLDVEAGQSPDAVLEAAQLVLGAPRTRADLDGYFRRNTREYSKQTCRWQPLQGTRWR